MCRVLSRHYFKAVSNMKLLSSFLVLLLLFSSCSTKENRLQNKISKNWQQNFTRNFTENEELKVFVVTNRNQRSTKFECGSKAFGSRMANDIKFGLCKINVPKNHDTRSINFSNNNRSSENSYYKTLAEDEIKEDDLISKIKDSKRTPLIFVHGFNVDYDDAILRISQIAYDLKYQGEIILFTWPAGNVDDDSRTISSVYQNNKNTARDSINYFRDLVEKLNDKGIKPNVMVHSMGHQVVLPALSQLAVRNSGDKAVQHLIMNAPDFDRKIFYGVAENIRNSSVTTTIYCADDDVAMTASKIANDGDRLGKCYPVGNNIDVINTSLLINVNSGIGHSYYFSREVLTDVAQILLGIPAEKRLFVKRENKNYSLRN